MYIVFIANPAWTHNYFDWLADLKRGGWYGAIIQVDPSKNVM